MNICLSEYILNIHYFSFYAISFITSLNYLSMKKIILFLLALILNFSLTVNSQPLTGIRTIKTSGGDYSSFTSAVTDLNALGVGSGGVTFKVSAGSVFNEANILITATGTASNPILFTKDGTGSNPLIKGQGINSSSSDYFFRIEGGDYITIDGIDLATDPSISDDLLKIEHGIFILNASITNGAQNITIKNCTITLEKTASNSHYGIRSVIPFNPSNPSGSNSNLTIDNVLVNKGKNGIYISGSSTYRNDNITIKNCLIGGVGNDIMSVLNTAYGIYIAGSSNIIVFNNEIRNISTSFTFYGIYTIALSGFCSINNNLIHNLRSTYSGGNYDLYGINVVPSPGRGDVYNNVLYDFDNLISNTTQAGYFNFEPIMTTDCNVYNNSVLLNSHSQYGNTILYWLNANCVAKNNIAYDLSTPGATSERDLFLTNSANVMENNLLFIDESGNNSYSVRIDAVAKKFKDFQKGTSLPSPGIFLNNIFGNPNFLSSVSLIPQYPTPASDNGQPIISVTSSYNGTDRSATKPDIGAYEGDFGVMQDLLPPVIKFQPIINNSDATVKLLAIITDNSEVTSSKLWYRIRNSSVNFIEVPGAKYGNSWDFSFVPPGPNTYEYFVCAKDEAGNVISNGFMTSGLNASTTGLAVNNPPAGIDYVYTFTHQPVSISGDFTVGYENANFTSLTGTGGLFDAINNSTISGNINAIITTDLIETGAVELKQWMESGAGNYYLTIKPHNATLHTLITFAAGKPSLVLNGADRVTIDGSYNNDKINHILINNATSNPIRILSNGTNGCDNISVKYCNLTAGASSALTSTGTNHSNWFFDNLYIDKGAAGINVFNVTNAIISNCIIGNTDINNTVTSYGFYIWNSSNVTIEKNTIRNILTSAAYNPRGILFYNVTGGACMKNKITGIKNTGALPYGAQGIYMSGVKSYIIANNIISDVIGPGSTSTIDYWISGIYLNTCSDLKLYYNTVNLFGTGNTTSSSYSSSISTWGSTNMEVINNIFSNSVANTITTSTTCGLLIYGPSPTNIFKNNIYYVGGTGTNRRQLVNINMDQRMLYNLIEWQSSENMLSNGIDLGSGAGDPKFVSGLNGNVALTTTSPALNSGSPVSITDDFSGNLRSSTSPDIGALEASYSLSSDIIAPVISIIPVPNSLNTTPSFSATITDNTAVTAAKFWYRIKGSTNAFSFVDGIKQVDNQTWLFTISTPLVTSSEYEYFICAKDGSGSIITNGIAAVGLNYSSTGLSTNNPSANPVFVRSFKVTDNSITTGTISGPFYISLSKSANVDIPFTMTGVYSSNDFIAFLSDNTGNFAGKAEIGRLSSNSAGTITGTVPNSTLSGTAYKIRVESTNPPITGTESLPFIIVIDNTSPTASLTSGTSTVYFGHIPVYITFSETITGFTQEDLIVTNGIISSFSGSNRNFTLIIDPESEGIVSVQLPAGAVKDLADNLNPASNKLELYYAILDAPRLNISPTDGNIRLNTSVKNITFTFDQDITGFDINDITVANGSKSNFLPDINFPNKIFTLDISPVSEGIVTVNVASNSVTNGSKGNTGSSLNMIYDITSPDVVLSRESGTGDVSAVFKILIAFDEIVKGFELSDLSVTNGIASNLLYFAGGVYTVDISPVNSGIVEVIINSGIATDLTGNDNTISNTLSANYVITGIIEPEESNFVVYPNPSDGSFKIETGDDNEYKIEIRDIEGKTVLSRRGTRLITINLKGNRPGIYFVIITKDKIRKTVPIIIN